MAEFLILTNRHLHFCRQKRAKLREELDLERYETDPESGGEDKPREGKGVRVYKSENALTTVTIAPLILNSDE